VVFLVYAYKLENLFISMPDPSSSDISNDVTSLAMVSEGELWNKLSPEVRSTILDQDVGNEANISNKTKNVYQGDLKNNSYENMSYYSLPPQIQFYVSNRLHEMGYFADSYGANVYEVDGDNIYKCKDCDEQFTAEEDFRVHKKVNHDNQESETESQEAYFRSLYIDPELTKDNLAWARQVLRGESARQTFPQNDAPTVTTPKLPKGRKEYDENPNHYFYDNKIFRKGTRSPYESGLTEAQTCIEVEEDILQKYGWESIKEVEKSPTNREIYASEVAQRIKANELHPRTLKILDSVNRPLLFKTLIRLGAFETQPEEYDEQVRKEEPIHQDYNPRHPHEHNDFDTYFGDKIAEEEISEEEHTGKHTEMADAIQRENPEYSRDRAMKIANAQIHKYNLESYSGESIAPDLLKDVDTSVMELEAQEYNIDEKVNIQANEAKTLSSYIGSKTYGGESVTDILEGAIDVPVVTETVEETIYNRKLNGYHEDKIARELWINHGIEHEEAVNKIRSVEVSDDDRVANTLFGKKLSECNQAEISEMKTLAGEAKKNTTGVNYA